MPDTSPGCPVPSANVYVNTPETFPVPAVDPTLATTVVLALTPAATTKVPVSELTPFAPETKFCAKPVELAADPKLIVVVAPPDEVDNTAKLSGIAPAGNINIA